ncbi:MAG: hypothetical protein ABH841_03240 [Candidatus Nealsonbacteria bacterium]
MKILSAITTITPEAWRSKITEIKKFKLREVCLFLTCLNAEERQELYSLLSDTSIQCVPFVHIRTDMTIQELEFLEQTYGTKLFNIHSLKEFPLIYDYGSRKKRICVENNHYTFEEREIQEFGGTCLDLSHLENDRLLHPESYRRIINFLTKYPPRCSHVSAIKKKPFLNGNGFQRYDIHTLADLSEFDYLKRYPLEYFGQIAAIELENPIKEQLEVQEYINALIKNK